VVVDFSHTPQALQVAIDAARVHCRGELWVVFGCGGDRDPGKRAPMAAAAEAADHVVLTDDNPRTERSEDIIGDALKGFSKPEAVTIIADRASAIAYAIRAAAVDDLVLIAGKGHEDYQIIGTTRHPFSDREQALAVLEQAS
jgi:UDP-N-acetylmuramoyl-L-alanyl-D-glutamate--2,6-diaminopimelate ligase